MFSILFSLLFLTSFTHAVDVAAPVSQGLQNLAGDWCSDYQEDKVKEALDKASCHDYSSNSAEQRKSFQVAKLREVIETDAEDRYFAALALQHSQELVCGSAYAKKVASGDSANADELKRKFEKLRLTKAAMKDAAQAVQTKSGMKVCPLSEAELKLDIPENQRSSNPDYALCLDMIASRELFHRSLSEIPLAGTPSVEKLINAYQDRSTALSDSEFKETLQAAYATAEGDMVEQARELHVRAKVKGGADFNRNEKRTLISNPLVNEKVFNAGGGGKDFSSLICRADARYGKGADRLDKTLFFGSFIASGSAVAVAKAGVKAVQVMRVITGTEMTVGGLQLATRVAAYGAGAGVGASEIYRSCASQSQKLQVTKNANACVDQPTVEQLKQDSCIFALSVPAMNFGTVAMAGRMAKIAEEAKATQEISRTEAVAKAVSDGKARELVMKKQKEIADRKAQGIETLEWKAKTDPKDMPDLSRVDETNGRNVNPFKKRRSIQNTQKKKEQQIEASRKNHEERYRLEKLYEEKGFEGYDLEMKVKRHIEIDTLKAENKLIETAPTEMNLSSDSFVKGGKGAFQSKAGDIRLITPEQFKALPENTRLYNFKTGEDYIVGIDDLKDVSTLNRKIGGKFTEWGFKVQP